MLRDTLITEVTFKNKPANLIVNSEVLTGNPNQIKKITFI